MFFIQYPTSIPLSNKKYGLDHLFGHPRVTSRSRQGVFGNPASCLSDSEFLPGWKKYPGVAETMIKAKNTIGAQLSKGEKFFAPTCS
ncbi:MAG: hypothetical protein V1852_13330 [Pseudomonadota bacterium]